MAFFIKENVDYVRIYQKQQQLLRTDLGIVHMGINHSLNMNESRNIITDVKRWLDFIKPIVRDYNTCQCVSNKIGAREILRFMLAIEEKVKAEKTLTDIEDPALNTPINQTGNKPYNKIFDC